MSTQLRGLHAGIQLATAFQLLPRDYISPYYRDESTLLGSGFSPHTLMLQLLAKAGDIFTCGREYYSHPNYRGDDKPTMIHQSSATGMQAISQQVYGARGFGIRRPLTPNFLYKRSGGEAPIVICSLGDASLAE